MPHPQLLLAIPKTTCPTPSCISQLQPHSPAPGLHPSPGHHYLGIPPQVPQSQLPAGKTILIIQPGQACSLCDLPVLLHSIAHGTHLLPFHVGQFSVPIILLHLFFLHPCSHCPSSRMGPWLLTWVSPPTCAHFPAVFPPLFMVRLIFP